MKAFTDTYNFVVGMVVTIMTAVFGVYWYIFAAYMFFNIASSFGIPQYKPYMLVVYEEGCLQQLLYSRAIKFAKSRCIAPIRYAIIRAYLMGGKSYGKY